MDLSHLSLQSRITAKDIPEVMENVRSRTHADLLRRIIINEEPTLQTLLSKPEVIGSAHWVVIGTPADAVEEIIRWYRHGALDGVIALPGSVNL